jgi:peptidyl-prolyl cis-trans isomerase D
MSIIQQIRDKAAVLLTSLIALSLLGFLVQDAFVGGGSSFFNSRPQSVGSINGVDVDVQEFNDKVNMAEQGYRSQGMQTDEMMTQNILDGIWNSYIQETLITGESDKVGISLTSKELGNLLFSENAPPEFRQLFTDPNTGLFDIQSAKTWFNNLKKSKRSDEMKMVSQQLLNPLKTRLLNDKYNSFFIQGSYAPKWMVEKMNTDNSSISSISYVSIPYASIPDTLSNLKVTDDEINKYVSEHRDEFKQDRVRNVSYVVFDANPTSADSAAVFGQLTSLKEEFLTVADAKSFVTRNNTSLPFFDGYVLKSRLQMSNKDQIAAMPNGGVIGPYLDATNFVIAKKLDTRLLPDSVKCRHILVGTTDPRSGNRLRDDSTAKRRADSIFNAIRSGSDFGLLAATLSDDEGSKDNRGEYKFSSMDMSNLAKEFADFIFYRPSGTREVVKTSFGYHVLEVMEQKNFEESYKMAYLSKRILASPETDNTASALATQFAANSRDPKSFEQNVVKMQLSKRLADNVKEMDFSLAGMPSRALVKWIFETKVGSVSEPFDLKDKYVVVAVNGEVPEGVQPATYARMMVEPVIRNRKKAAEIKKKLANAKTLEEAAAANNLQVMRADSVLFSNPFIPQIGNEPKVIGSAFDKAYQTRASSPIEGNNGIYMVKVNNIGAVPSAFADVNAQRKMAEMQLRQFASYSTPEALRKSAKITDKRRDAGY